MTIFLHTNDPLNNDTTNSPHNYQESISTNANSNHHININSSQPTIIIMPGTNLDNQNQLQQILNHFSSTSNSQRRL
ncbi:unnamed protein product [Rhizophagus irregularis]|nr:unnamed protein product [Rhizophagus irregularis]